LCSLATLYMLLFLAARQRICTRALFHEAKASLCFAATSHQANFSRGAPSLATSDLLRTATMAPFASRHANCGGKIT